MQTDIRVLIVDDDREFATDLATFLGPRFSPTLSHDADSAMEIIPSVDIVLLDIDLGGIRDGFWILEELRASGGAPPVIMLTGERKIQRVVQAIRAGAFHYVTKPPDIGELLHVLDQALQRISMQRRIEGLEEEVLRLSGDFVVSAPAMRRIVERVEKVAPTDAVVLITGECGTGKEMVARHLHSRSRQATGPFVGVNCAAVPNDLIESELFGHERGAFTGAERLRLGKFELATGGTLFLDEIGDSDPALQVKLLRAIEDRSFFRVGGERERHVNARLCAATSQDLERTVEKGTFRPELYYRLNVYRIHIPPLRERREEIPSLVKHFLHRSAKAYGRQAKEFTPEALDHLCQDPWRGNVRELRNVVERGVLESTSEAIGLEHLISPLGGFNEALGPYAQAKNVALEQFKRRYLAAQLRKAGGDIGKAAELSGVLRQSFGRMMREVGLGVDGFKEP